MFETTLKNLTKALRWIQDDDRNFDLEHPVIVDKDENTIGITIDGFIYEKLRWYLRKPR